MATTLPFLALFVSLCAFFRPEISKAFARLAGMIEFFPYVRFELGFTDMGPVIALTGSFRSSYSTLVVTEARLIVVRERDQSRHAMPWTIFRQRNFIDPSKTIIEPSVAFALNDATEKRIEILFSDIETKDRIERQYKPLREAFAKFCMEREIPFHELTLKEWEEIKIQYDAHMEPKTFEINDRLKSEIYWAAGSYTAKLEVKHTGRKSKSEYHYSFVISEEQAASLRLNAVWLVNQSCFKPPYSPPNADEAYFVYPTLTQ